MGFIGAVIGLAVAIALLLVALRVVGMISQEQGRKGFSDDSNRVGRVLAGVLGAFSRRSRS